MATVIEANEIMIYWWERKLILTVVNLADPVYKNVLPAAPWYCWLPVCDVRGRENG
jgi:hypothetical protein